MLVNKTRKDLSGQSVRVATRMGSPGEILVDQITQKDGRPHTHTYMVAAQRWEERMVMVPNFWYATPSL